MMGKGRLESVYLGWWMRCNLKVKDVIALVFVAGMYRFMSQK